MGEHQPEQLLDLMSAAPEPPELGELLRLVGRLDDRQARRLLALASGAEGALPFQPLLLEALERSPLLAEASWREPLLELEAPGQELLLLQSIGRFRHPACAARLRRHLHQDQGISGAAGALLMPLLGYQRCCEDFPLLLEAVRRPDPAPLRRAALEGLARGLSAWPLGPLTALLEELAGDLDPGLASTAVDLIARLPGGDLVMRSLAAQPLDPAVARRLQRCLGAHAPSPLLLLVHGRSGGEIPAELQELALKLERRRGAPVRLQALSTPCGSVDSFGSGQVAGLTLMPLLLLPGSHVRHDLPAIAAQWRERLGPQRYVRRLPFLGAWPQWQRLLAERAAEVRQPTREPIWCHHPLEGPLAERYLRHLSAVSGARCQPLDAGAEPATPYTQSTTADDQGALLLPLALATSRLSELLGPPLLHHPRLRQVLLDQLVALP